MTPDLVAVKKCKRCTVVISSPTETKIILCSDHRIKKGKNNGRN